MVSGAMAEPIRQIAQEFARHNGYSINLIVGTTQSQARRIKSGEKPDLVEVNAAAMDVLQQGMEVVPKTRIELARANIAVAVPDAATVPKIVTPDDLKRVLISAHGVALTDPKIRSQATEAIQNLFRRLGIQNEMLRKTVPGTTGLDAVQKMADGQADLAISFESEILPIKGAKFVARVPVGLQDATVFAGAIGASSTQPDAANALLREIAGPRGREIIRRAGLEPLTANGKVPP
jgi:molybdate transport system substrate-binding protein